MLLPGLWTIVEMTAVGLPGETLYFQEQCYLLLVKTVVARAELRKMWLIKQLKVPPHAQKCKISKMIENLPAFGSLSA